MTAGLWRPAMSRPLSPVALRVLRAMADGATLEPIPCRFDDRLSTTGERVRWNVAPALERRKLICVRHR
jgi:hypothetical protein